VQDGKFQRLNESNHWGNKESPAPGRLPRDESRRQVCLIGRKRELRIALFGHFGQFNFGNESTLEAILAHLRSLEPKAHFSCICTEPSSVAALHGIAALPSRIPLAERWKPARLPGRLLRKLVVEILGELCQWLHSLRTMRGVGALVIPGTGLLTDADTLLSWGPYDLFRWSAAAKLCGCKLLFVSVGAGPLSTRTGRLLVKAALSLADYRSYRDPSTESCLRSIGLKTLGDRVYPDLVFSLPAPAVPADSHRPKERLVVGLGLMKVPRARLTQEGSRAACATYLESLAAFADWLFSQRYDVRLLYGDIADASTIQEFKSLLKNVSANYEEQRLVDEPIASVDDLLRQIAATDLMVATRYHNVLLALLLRKPVIAIAYHHKCTSLMSRMGLSEYCLPLDRLNPAVLIERFSRLQASADSVTRVIDEGVEACGRLLDEQYALVLGKMCSRG